MNCPYSKLELLLALSAAEKKFTGKEDDIKKSMESIFNEEANPWLIAEGDGKKAKEEAAKFHGISVADFINSPNYETLKKEYDEYYAQRLLDLIKEAGFSDKEAWAIAVGVCDPTFFDGGLF